MIKNKSPIKEENHKLQKFNLEDRTTQFSLSVISLCRTLSFSMITKPLIDQIIRSATSIGANYREANGCDSRKDFKNKIGICKREAKETMYWLHLLSDCYKSEIFKLQQLWKEAHELSLIFAAIINKIK